MGILVVVLFDSSVASFSIPSSGPLLTLLVQVLFLVSWSDYIHTQGHRKTHVNKPREVNGP